MNDEKRPYPKRIVVDFDGTICGFAFPDCGPPEPHVKMGLQRLKDAGFEIIIHSVSTNTNWGHSNRWKHFCRITDYMKEHNLPYDMVETNIDKPFATVYIDDRGVAYRGNWLEVAEQAIELGEKE